MSIEQSYNISLAKPIFEQEAINALLKVVASGKLVQGEQVSLFENAIKHYTKAKHAIAVNSATSGLYMLMRTLGIGAGDEVIVPAFSYIATANIVEHANAKIVFCDIASNGYNIDIQKVETLITKKTKAIVVVHEFGEPADMRKLQQIAEKNKIIIIEDCACALGSFSQKVHVGNQGAAGVFSFHPRKSITCGDGGVIITNNDDIASSLRKMRNHGLENYGGAAQSFRDIGLNFRMTELQAVLLNQQIYKIDELIKQKKENAQKYDFLLSNRFQKPNIHTQGHSWQSYHLLAESSNLRDHIISSLRKKNIYITLGAQNITQEPYYLEKYGSDLNTYKYAHTANTCGFVLPIHENLTDQEINYVADNLNEVINNAEK